VSGSLVLVAAAVAVLLLVVVAVVVPAVAVVAVPCSNSIGDMALVVEQMEGERAREGSGAFWLLAHIIF